METLRFTRKRAMDSQISHREILTENQSNEVKRVRRDSISFVVPHGMRGNSPCSSSGYESQNENASSSGSITPTLNTKAIWTRSQQNQFKPATEAKCRKDSQSEYVVERIVSLESINAKPAFFVKWLNYANYKNTWESLDNLIAFEVLQEFIDSQMNNFAETIAEIQVEIETEIQSLPLHTSIDKINANEPNEPLKLLVDLVLLAQFRQTRLRRQCEVKIIRDRAIKLKLHELRKQQLKDLQMWEQRINVIEWEAPIKIENNVDLEGLDKKFNYITASIPSNGVVIIENSIIGCMCDLGCTSTANCCANMAGGTFAYNKRGRLCIKPGEAIYECNKNCSCDSNCKNRRIQQGRKNSLCLFKTTTGCGWGVRTEQMIRKGEYVCEFVGEILTTEEANEREKIKNPNGHRYLFDLDFNITAEAVYTIDARMHGNISRFINHSCDPNLAVFPFWVNNLDIAMPRLAFFALRKINVGEELSFDYIRRNTDVQVHKSQNLTKTKKTSCRCGAKNCRKVVF